jgi:hypothetical protein
MVDSDIFGMASYSDSAETRLVDILMLGSNCYDAAKLVPVEQASFLLYYSTFLLSTAVHLLCTRASFLHFNPFHDREPNTKHKETTFWGICKQGIKHDWNKLL